jgi:hypothetical protein
MMRDSAVLGVVSSFAKIRHRCNDEVKCARVHVIDCLGKGKLLDGDVRTTVQWIESRQDMTAGPAWHTNDGAGFSSIASGLYRHTLESQVRHVFRVLIRGKRDQTICGLHINQSLTLCHSA